jgi:hypothetical protein
MTSSHSDNTELHVQARANSLDRLDKSMGELNARIARLALALGVSLENEEEVRSILSHRPDARPMHAEQGPRFQQMEHEHVLIELRGLLIMRYGIERHVAEDQGASVVRRVLEQAEAELSKHGFKPGADGLDLEQLFKRD